MRIDLKIENCTFKEDYVEVEEEIRYSQFSIFKIFDKNDRVKRYKTTTILYSAIIDSKEYRFFSQPLNIDSDNIKFRILFNNDIYILLDEVTGQYNFVT